jgi:HEAT repeat protein
MSETPETLEAPHLVDLLAATEASRRHEVLAALQRHGKAALPAVCDGLKHGNWQVRRWCAIFLDHDGDLRSLGLLIPLLRDRRRRSGSGPSTPSPATAASRARTHSTSSRS